MYLRATQSLANLSNDLSLLEKTKKKEIICVFFAQVSPHPIWQPAKLNHYSRRVAVWDNFCFKIGINAFFANLTESTTCLIFWHDLPNPVN
jgi:hypothetical protein